MVACPRFRRIEARRRPFFGRPWEAAPLGRVTNSAGNDHPRGRLPLCEPDRDPTDTEIDHEADFSPPRPPWAFLPRRLSPSHRDGASTSGGATVMPPGGRRARHHGQRHRRDGRCGPHGGDTAAQPSGGMMGTDDTSTSSTTPEARRPTARRRRHGPGGGCGGQLLDAVGRPGAGPGAGLTPWPRPERRAAPPFRRGGVFHGGPGGNAAARLGIPPRRTIFRGQTHDPAHRPRPPSRRRPGASRERPDAGAGRLPAGPQRVAAGERAAGRRHGHRLGRRRPGDRAARADCRTASAPTA